MDNIYLDNAATTPVDERVLDAMLPYLKSDFGNASSVHRFGRVAKVLLEDARDTIADFIGSRSSEVYFTSGGTEANNFAIKGIAFQHLNYTQKRIISSKIEHSAVIDTLEYLKSRFGFSITYLDNDKYGIVNIDHLKNTITDQTFLVCVMHSNNELGVINDIPRIAEIAHEKGALLHTDTVQALGKIYFKIEELNCNTASFSAHKIYGPKGIGALYIKKNTPIDKLIHGGKQERDRRGGTENISAIAGFKKAIELLKDHMDSDIANYKMLKEKLIHGLNKSFGDSIIINTITENSYSNSDATKGRSVSLNNIVNISFNPQKVKLDADTALIKLDLAGIAVSSGSACTSGSIQPSHVLKALGYDDETAKSSLRISFGRYTKEDDIDKFIETLKNILAA